MICEFMDISRNVMNKDQWIVPYELTGGEAIIYQTFQLKFSKSWNWLMPVVDKIIEMGYPLNIDTSWVFVHIPNNLIAVQYKDYPSKVETVYDAVVKAIECINKNEEWIKQNKNSYV